MSFIQHLWSDPETMKLLGGPIKLPEEKHADWFARMVVPGNPHDRFFLILDSYGTRVGEVSFHRWDPRLKSAELNIKVLAAYRGQGLARSALLVFLDLFFGQFGGCVMTDDVAPGNLAGQRLLESFGFRRVPAPPDVNGLVLTKDDYLSLTSRPQE